MMRQGDRCFLHLVHAQMNLPGSGGYCPVETTQPLADVVVWAACEADEVLLQPDDEALEWEACDGGCRVVIPKLDMYGVVEFRGV